MKQYHILIIFFILYIFTSCTRKENDDLWPLTAIAFASQQTVTETTTSTETDTVTNTNTSSESMTDTATDTATSTVLSISFSSSSLSVTVGAATTNTPTANDSITSCSISPSLPTGLSISSTSCAISGTPNVPQSSTSYSITPSNPSGSGSTVSVSITSICPTGGFSANGYCWFAGSAGESCNTACTNQSLHCEPVQVNDYTGRNGSTSNCQTVLDGLSLGTGAVANSGTPTDAIGCAYTTVPFAARIIANTNSTSCFGTSTNYQRACPCMAIAGP
ncbi:MAG: putative Ig domain-containing protein [Spirochaetota bacterium]